MATKPRKNKWEVLKHPLLVGLVVVVVGGFVTYLVKSPLSSSPTNNGNIAKLTSVSVGGNNYGQVAGGSIVNKTVVTQSQIAVQQQDYIEGTEYTAKDLKNLFPFGYAIIYFSQNTRDRHKVFKTGLMEWSLDWDKTKIAPDIANGTVSWEIVIASAGNPDREQSWKGGLMTDKTDFKNGAFGMGIQFDRDQPVLYWVTLSANQQSPVFAIGCRIPTADERKNHIIRIP